MMCMYNLVLNISCFLYLSESRKLHDALPYKAQNLLAMTIIVDQTGKGNFTKIQDAINHVPSYSKYWTRIQINIGVYREKIEIPADKENIFMVGLGQKYTVIEWEEAGSSTESYAFAVKAENFKAQYITFKNKYNTITDRDENGRPMSWAPAILVDADKACFFRCSFISLQDTLWDNNGRHFFKYCYIEGAVDFIWGDGQSIYEDCTINFNGAALKGTPGYITAQGRQSLTDGGGFIFNRGNLIGTGSAYLGRAYRQYARVLLNMMNLSSIVVPEGWNAWNQPRTKSISFAENQCTGPGADMSKRVKWEKKFSSQQIKALTDVDRFINKDGWLRMQPRLTLYEN